MSDRARGEQSGSGAPRVLCYSPYNLWILHGMWEVTILHALKLRGADVRYVLCDGLYSDCDVFRAAVLPRHPFSCAQCQAQVTRLAAILGTTFEWLGRYLEPDDFREAERWSRALRAPDFTTATYRDWPIGEWVQSSVHSHHRMSELDLRLPELQDLYRSYLYSGLVACFGLSRLLDDYDPDVLFLFSGTMSSTRVAFELARRRGVRVICHERGYLSDSIRLMENAPSEALQPVKQMWADWGGVPLRQPELETISQYLAQREQGMNFGWPAFSPPRQDLDEVRQRLGLNPSRPVGVLYTSSDDEVAAHREWGGPFAHQLEWVERTVTYARTHPELDLVIRVHPNTGGKRAHGTNMTQLQQLEALRLRLPPNVRMIMPDDPISSYSLMDIATLGLVYQSTAGLEMACKNKPVIVAAGGLVSNLPFVTTVQGADTYETLLDGMMNQALRAQPVDTQRLAYRFAYALFFRANTPFPLVKMAPDPPKLMYRSLDALASGREPNLDRITRIILQDEPVCPPPTAIEQLRPDADEMTWFRTGPNAQAPPARTIPDTKTMSPVLTSTDAAEGTNLPRIADVLAQSINRPSMKR